MDHRIKILLNYWCRIAALKRLLLFLIYLCTSEAQSNKCPDGSISLAGLAISDIFTGANAPRTALEQCHPTTTAWPAGTPLLFERWQILMSQIRRKNDPLPDPKTGS